MKQTSTSTIRFKYSLTSTIRYFHQCSMDNLIKISQFWSNTNLIRPLTKAVLSLAKKLN